MNRPGRTSAVTRLLFGLVLVAGCAGPVNPSSTPTKEATPTNEAPAPAGWHPIADSALFARHSAHAFWTGTEVLVLGGDAAVPRCPPWADCAREPTELLSDGAAFNPRSGTWRQLTPAPVPLGYLSGAIVEGNLYVWVPEVRPAGGLNGAFLRYQIADDRWEELPSPAGPTESLVLLAAGSRVVAYRPTQETEIAPDQAYDPRPGTWSDLPLDPLVPSYDRAVVWTGQSLVALGIRLDPTRPPNKPPTYAAAALDPAAGEWRRLPDSEIVGWNPSWFWAGGRIVNPTIGSADGGEVNNWGRQYPFGGLLTPPAAEWSALPDLPPGRGGYTGLSVAGPEHAVSTEGWVFHIPTQSWSPLPQPPRAADHGEAVAWAGDRLVVWGGVIWNGDQPTLLDSGWMWLP